MNIYYYKYENGEFTVKPIEVKETEKLYKMRCLGGYSQIRKDDIGKARGDYCDTSASVYLNKRDDEKAKDLLFKYFNGSITGMVSEKERIDRRISDITEAQDRLLKTSIKEKEEKENE